MTSLDQLPPWPAATVYASPDGDLTVIGGDSGDIGRCLLALRARLTLATRELDFCREAMLDAVTLTKLGDARLREVVAACREAA